MNTLEKIIGYISPTWQFKREFSRRQAQLMASITASETVPAWDGASKSKRGLKSWLPTALSADRENSAELPTLTARSRDLFRNDTLARSAITTSVTNVVGSGLRRHAENWQTHVDRKLNQVAPIQKAHRQGTRRFVEIHCPYDDQVR